MKFFFFIIAIIFSITVFSQELDSNIPIELQEAYEFDVSWLALDRIMEVNSVYKDSIFIPESFKDTIWNSLVPVFNSISIPERDSIFDIYCIHNETSFGHGVLNIGILVDSQVPWYDNWENSIIETGNTDLDNLLFSCNFEFLIFSDNWASLRTHDFVNLAVVLDSLESFEGIDWAIDAKSESQFNTISYSKEEGYSRLSFGLYFGCGPIICANHYSWTFEIGNQANVELVGSQHFVSDYSESPLTPNCHITGVAEVKEDKAKLLISPNPANEYINISTTIKKVKKIVIYDALGSTKYTREIDKELTVFLSNYSSGLYLLKVFDDNYKQIDVQKFIKQ